MKRAAMIKTLGGLLREVEEIIDVNGEDAKKWPLFMGDDFSCCEELGIAVRASFNDKSVELGLYWHDIGKVMQE